MNRNDLIGAVTNKLFVKQFFKKMTTYLLCNY